MGIKCILAKLKNNTVLNHLYKTFNYFPGQIILKSQLKFKFYIERVLEKSIKSLFKQNI